VDHEALGRPDLGERPFRPMLEPFGRAHADLERAPDPQLDRGFGDRIAVWAEPSLDRVGGAPGLEHGFARRGEGARNADRGGLEPSPYLIDLVHRFLLRGSGFEDSRRAGRGGAPIRASALRSIARPRPAPPD